MRPRDVLAVIVCAGAIIAVIAAIVLNPDRPFEPSRRSCEAQRSERRCLAGGAGVVDGPSCWWIDGRCTYSNGSLDVEVSATASPPP
jgi:hypothetical protein